MWEGKTEISLEVELKKPMQCYVKFGLAVVYALY